MECVYCKKTYASLSSLRAHQINTKSCLAIQQQEGVERDPRFLCEYCNRQYTSNQRFKNHQCTMKEKVLKERERIALAKAVEENVVVPVSIAVSTVQAELPTTLNESTTTRSIPFHEAIQTMEDKIEELEFKNRNLKEEFEHELRLKDQKMKEELRVKDQKIKELEARSITKNIQKNKFIININEVMTPERVEDFFKKHYNIDTLLGGQRGLARFVCDKFIMESGVYQCVDRSRQKFVTFENEISTEDPDCQRLVGLTSPGLPHIKDVYEDALFSIPVDVTELDIHDRYKSIVSLDLDRTQFKNELSKIVPSSHEPQTNNQYEHAVQQMKQMRDANKVDTGKMENTDVPQIRKIGEFTHGFLDTFRKKYHESVDKKIQGPKKLVEQFATNPTLQQQYIDFITGVDPVYPSAF